MIGLKESPFGGGETRRFRFGLGTLFALTFVWALFFAILAMFGMGWAVVDAVGAAWLSGLVICRRKWLEWTACMVVLGLIVYWVCPGFRSPRERYGHRASCKSRLCELSLALQNYNDVYGCLPPAYIADESGKPMHSWRVLLLPYLELTPLYEEYNFDEPWDGPNNRKLHISMPGAYCCPSDNPDGNFTSYVAVVGPNTTLRADKSLDMWDVEAASDDPAATVVISETVNSGIHWMEPRDLHVTQMATSINPPAGQGISSNHPGGARVLCADGFVRLLSAEDVSPKQLQSMLTVGDGKVVDIEQLDID